MIKQLSGLDAIFLYLETGSSFGHVNSVALYDRPDDDPDFSPFDAMREQIGSRLGLLEPFRRRLVEVPMSLDHPYWVDDPDFDLDFHIRHIGIPPPGDDEQLANQVSRIIGRPMDRSHPLWEIYVMEGLESGQFAVLTKIHHATIDGAAGAALASLMLDREPHADPLPAAAGTWSPDAVPGTSELLARTAVQYARRPVKAVRLQVNALRALGEITRNPGFDLMAERIREGLPGPVGEATRRLLRVNEPLERHEPDHPPDTDGLTAPRTLFNRSITPHRRFAFRSVPLADIKAIKTAAGATVNDVVMAICTGALRTYLQEHDDLPDENLVAMIPVSIRTGDEEDPWTNRVSALFPRIPTTIEDPGERLRFIHEHMQSAKETHDLLPADLLVEASELAPAALAVRAARIAARTHVVDRMNPPANLVISNVPGPREPLYIRGGARMTNYYPVSTVVDGQALNITVQSYLDTLDFGLVACREIVPDLSLLADLCIEETSTLTKAVGVKTKKKRAKK